MRRPVPMNAHMPDEPITPALFAKRGARPGSAVRTGPINATPGPTSAPATSRLTYQ